VLRWRGGVGITYTIRRHRRAVAARTLVWTLNGDDSQTRRLRFVRPRGGLGSGLTLNGAVSVMTLRLTRLREFVSSRRLLACRTARLCVWSVSRATVQIAATMKTSRL
jgi:hypothetical protein